MPRDKIDFFYHTMMSYRAVPETYAALVERIIDVLARITCDYLIGERCTKLTNYAACELGVDELITRYIMEPICYGDHTELIDRCVVDYEAGLLGACRGGHYRTACWLIAQGARNFDEALYTACHRGYIEITELILETSKHYVNRTPSILIETLDYALCSACYAGRITLAELMIQAGARNFNGALHSACKGGHEKLIARMIKAGASDFDRALCGACCEGRIAIAEQMIRAGATNFNKALRRACHGGHKELVARMIEAGADNFTDALYTACEMGHTEIAEFMINIGAEGAGVGYHLAYIAGHMECANRMHKYHTAGN